MFVPCVFATGGGSNSSRFSGDFGGSGSLSRGRSRSRSRGRSSSRRSSGGGGGSSSSRRSSGSSRSRSVSKQFSAEIRLFQTGCLSSAFSGSWPSSSFQLACQLSQCPLS